MHPYTEILMHTLSDQLYEFQFEQNRKIAEAVIAHLEEFGVTLPQFLQGLGTLLDEQKYSQSAALVQKAQFFLQQTYQLNKDSL
jgi:hypothetical protein